MSNVRGILILFLIFVVAPFAFLALIWKDRCQRTSVAVVRSPDGHWAAETTRVDCGSSMKVASEVTLREAEEKDGESVLVIAEEKGLEMGWEDAGHLTLRLPPNAEVVKSTSIWKGVAITVVGPKR